MLANRLYDNLDGILELYEASYLALEGKSILADATIASMVNIMKMGSHCESELAKKISHALELPLQMRVQWFDVKWQISHYKEGEQTNPRLLELAKLNFNIVQATHQQELREISRWWRNLGLIENLSFARDRSVECFLWSIGTTFDLQYGLLRKALAKAVNLILVIDDIYDIYGSRDELQQFTNAVDRWNSTETEKLPECIKHCFYALCDITSEAACELEREKGWKNVLPYLKKAWAGFCKSLLVEAK